MARIDAGCNQRQIVRLPAAAAVIHDRSQHAMAEFRGCRLPLPIQDLKQAVIAELFAGRIAGFRNAVADDHQPIAGGKLDALLRCRQGGENPDRRREAVQSNAFTSAVEQQGRIVSGIGISQYPRFGIVNSVEHGCEFVRRGRLEEQTVDSGENLAAVPIGGRRVGANGGVQRCAQQRRRHALPRHVGQEQSQSLRPQRDEIVPIAADAQGRPADPRIINARNGGATLREQPVLDFERLSELFLPLHALRPAKFREARLRPREDVHSPVSTLLGS